MPGEVVRDVCPIPAFVAVTSRCEELMDPVLKKLSENLEAVRASVSAACSRVRRPLDDVRLIAVTKYAQLEWIDGLIALGQKEFGENRPQQMVERQSRWPHVAWHLIGHLQRNKAKLVVGRTSLVHSIDSVRLAERLSEVTQEDAGDPLPVLCEVNVSGETSKDGFRPDELRTAWEYLLSLRGIRVLGLMTMAPQDEQAESARPFFRQLRELRDELRSQSPPDVALTDLSMGMSGDYEVAIEEGATLIRVGSRLFEGLS